MEAYEGVSAITVCSEHIDSADIYISGQKHVSVDVFVMHKMQSGRMRSSLP